MAPKKKKKPASNPARGFATVSLPSKTRADDDVPQADTVLPEVGNDESIGGEPRGTVDMIQPLQAHSSFQDMTADEMQEHLEDAEIQDIVDKSAERSRR